MEGRHDAASGVFTPLYAVLCSVLILVSACSDKPKPPQPEEVLKSPPAYNYPINNPYAATIIGLPPEMKVDFSSVPKPEDKTITLYAGRDIPEGFWYDRGLKYSQLLQPKPAPLIYVIAGTGADSESNTVIKLADILYAGGFSVVMLPSPTHPDFIINASRNYMVGRPSQDAEDLYRLIRAVDRTFPQSSVTRRMLIGYSLGGLDAAFTAKLDSEQKAVNFSKVLLINPPLNLYHSMQIIDHMLYRALPNGIDGAARFLKSVIVRLSSVGQGSDALDFTNERVLLEAYEKYQPSDDRLATTIGLSFRLAAADMIFTSDVMTHSGYIFPKNIPFETTTHLTPYLSVALRTSFINYFDELYTEKFRADDPHLSAQDLIDEGDLSRMKDFLADNPKIGLMTNRDDIILAPGDVQKLASLFGDRATVWPNGGHLGNIALPAVTYHIVHFMGQ